MKAYSLGVLVALLVLVQDASAYRMELNGLVTDYGTMLPMAKARVRIYKNGMLQTVRWTGGAGRYSMVLDNHAAYVVRIDAPGYQAKCITVDTQGLEWEGDGRISRVEVEMRLPRSRPGIDLSYFDLPLGMARFEPASGHTRWNLAYEGKVLAASKPIMEAYGKRSKELGFPLPVGNVDLGAVLPHDAIPQGGL